MNDWLHYLEGTSVAVAISQGTNAFPWIETVHVLAITTVFGTIAIVDLRLLGYASHRKGARQLIHDLLPYTWLAFVVAVASGALMFISNAVTYAGNAFFQAKMLMILAAGLNMALFHLTTHRRIADWDDLLPTPVAAQIAGGVSLLLWIAVIILGRWIGFTLF